MAYQNEREFLDMVLEQQLKAIDHAKCRLMTYVEMSREAMSVRSVRAREFQSYHFLLLLREKHSNAHSNVTKSRTPTLEHRYRTLKDVL